MIEFIRKNGPSFIGHIVEGQAWATICCGIAMLALGWRWWQAYTVCGLVVPWLYFYGREKRDCETALDMHTGLRLSAYWLLWTRPSNITDLIGNPLVYGAVMAMHWAGLFDRL